MNILLLKTTSEETSNYVLSNKGFCLKNKPSEILDNNEQVDIVLLAQKNYEGEDEIYGMAFAPLINEEHGKADIFNDSGYNYNYYMYFQLNKNLKTKLYKKPETIIQASDFPIFFVFNNPTLISKIFTDDGIKYYKDNRSFVYITVNHFKKNIYQNLEKMWNNFKDTHKKVLTMYKSIQLLKIKKEIDKKYPNVKQGEEFYIKQSFNKKTLLKVKDYVMKSDSSGTYYLITASDDHEYDCRKVEWKKS